MAKQFRISAVSPTGKKMRIASYMAWGFFSGRVFCNDISDVYDKAYEMSKSGDLVFVIDWQILHIICAYKDGKQLDYNFSASDIMKEIEAKEAHND